MRPYAFSPALRLKKTDDFSSVFRFRGVQKKVLRGAWLEVLAVPCIEVTPFPRLGIVVGKKAFPRAVDRNHFKRLVREAFRKRQHDLGALAIIVRLMRAPAPIQVRSERWEALATECHTLFHALITANAGALPQN